MILKKKKTLPRIKKKLKLVAILIGQNNLSKIFIKKKEEICQRVGIDFESYFFPTNISFGDLRKEIEKICQKKTTSGVIIQLPLPSKFKKKEQEILDLVPIKKDIDLLSSNNLGKYYLSPIVKAVKFILDKKTKIKGKYVVLIGAGRLTGLPLSSWFLSQGAYVSVLNETTPDLSVFTKKADILISATGQAGLIKKTMIKKDSIVIDIGNSLVNGKIKGDIEYSEKAKYFVPAVGGIGPIMVAYLLENLIEFNS